MTKRAHNHLLTTTSSGTSKGYFAPPNLFNACVIPETSGEPSSACCLIDRGL